MMGYNEDNEKAQTGGSINLISLLITAAKEGKASHRLGWASKRGCKVHVKVGPALSLCYGQGMRLNNLYS